MPYREMPPRVLAQAGDPANVTRAFARRERYGRLSTSALWSAPSENPFDAQGIDAAAVSALGTRAIMCAGTRAWLVDLDTMTATTKVDLPRSATICALNHDASRAAIVCGEVLYQWRRGSDGLEKIWTSPGLSGSEVLELSRDGRIAITSRYSRRAQIRVFDLDRSTLTFSFKTDADECLLLHPDGNHLIAFGDDAIVRIYGRGGLESQLEKTTGGAISPDGGTLIMNDYNSNRELRRYDVNTSGARLALRPLERFSLRRDIEFWDTKMVFSPSGRQALVSCGSEFGQLVNMGSGASSLVDITIGRKMAFSADESLLLAPGASAREHGVKSYGVSVQSVANGTVHGVVVASSGQLAAITPLGLFGSIEADPSHLGNEQALPYERPGLVSTALRRNTMALSADDQVLLEEVRERSAAWTPFFGALTVDITLRQLMSVNRGLIELTPEIVHRALTAENDDTTPRFGAPQVNLHALEAVADDLRSLAGAAREEAFAGMIERLRPRPKEPEPPPKTPDWVETELTMFEDDEDEAFELTPSLFAHSAPAPPAAAPPPLPAKPVASYPRVAETAIELAKETSLVRTGPVVAIAAAGGLGLIALLIYLLTSI